MTLFGEHAKFPCEVGQDVHVQEKMDALSFGPLVSGAIDLNPQVDVKLGPTVQHIYIDGLADFFTLER